MSYTERSRQATVVAYKETNAVLRNTYWLLALSLVPTVIGSLLALNMQWYLYMRGFTGVLIFFGATFGTMFLIQKNRDNAMGVVFLLLFTFIMGVFLSSALAVAQLFSNGGELITLAFVGTLAVLVTMATVATVAKRDFGFMAQTLTIGAVVLIVLSIANVFLHLPALSLAVSAMAIVIFSAFLLIDLQRVVRGGETNYIMATLSIYLDLYNIFVSLLNILLAVAGRRD